MSTEDENENRRRSSGNCRQLKNNPGFRDNETTRWRKWSSLEGSTPKDKAEDKQAAHLIPRVAPLGMNDFERGSQMIAKIHSDILKELNLTEEEGEQSTKLHWKSSDLRMYEEKKAIRERIAC